jgi:hypothetical protein
MRKLFDKASAVFRGGLVVGIEYDEDHTAIMTCFKH